MNWIANVGITYYEDGRECRIEAGDVVPDDLTRAAGWLITQGHVTGGWSETAIPVVVIPPDIALPQDTAPEPGEEHDGG